MKDQNEGESGVATKSQIRWWIFLTIVVWILLTTVFEIANWTILPFFVELCDCGDTWLRLAGFLGNAVVSFLISGMVVTFTMLVLARWIVPGGILLLAYFNRKKL